MKFLKGILQNLAARFSRIWEKATAVDHESYLREREIMEVRERARMRVMYLRGWL